VPDEAVFNYPRQCQWDNLTTHKPAGMNTEHPTHDTHTELRAMHFDKGVRHFASLAKYTVAFRRKNDNQSFFNPASI